MCVRVCACARVFMCVRINRGRFTCCFCLLTTLQNVFSNRMCSHIERSTVGASHAASIRTQYLLQCQKRPSTVSKETYYSASIRTQYTHTCTHTCTHIQDTAQRRRENKCKNLLSVLSVDKNNKIKIRALYGDKVPDDTVQYQALGTHTIFFKKIGHLTATKYQLFQYNIKRSVHLVSKLN
jgi:hypothetical protein